eukprot:gnl/TRDRNA2_/TRDRNA2_163981_c2_seq1.p1 gnl/TRDRNA2_/TRDRNA2_163981_c2~~gnl/TRDRNA2_/TRDRNA2_163981_c2_seq1.p1  ORF type:complete len:249 (-),score=47.45 gnl/TRDRNA2_/TRDRNA2_163981_c2_seq1:25-663(-)
MKASHRQRIDMMRETHHGQDFVMNTLDGFKNMLKQKYGSLFSAFRQCLDADKNGIVTETDFAIACRKLGVKATRQLWKDIDVDRNGQISIHELDYNLGEHFFELENLLIKGWGTTKEGWKRAIDPRGDLRVNKPEFVERVKKLGYTRDAEDLYKMVKPEPGRAYLTYEDLWLNLNMNQAHGETSAPVERKAAVPKAPKRRPAAETQPEKDGD